MDGTTTYCMIRPHVRTGDLVLFSGNGVASNLRLLHAESIQYTTSRFCGREKAVPGCLE